MLGITLLTTNDFHISYVFKVALSSKDVVDLCTSSTRSKSNDLAVWFLEACVSDSEVSSSV